MERHCRLPAPAEYGLAAMSHRGGVLGWPGGAAAAGGQIRADLPVRAGGVRPVLPGVDDRFADAHAAQVRRRRSWSRATCRALTTQDFDELRQGAMFMTEQGAGSDVAATATARRADGDAWRCTATSGSAPTPMPTWRWCWRASTGAGRGMKGVSLFLLPRGSRTARPTPTGSCG
jgi:acyl-CoA dehydrogenase